MGHGRKPDLDGLRSFIEDEDRDQARFFVGREAQIRSIRRLAARVHGERSSSATRVIQGAPGAGKTALLCRMKELWTGPDDPHVVSCDVGVVSTPAKLARAIVKVVAPRLAKEFLGASSVDARAGVSLLIFSLTGRRSKGGRPPTEDPWAWLCERLPPKKWKRPLCLMVDEIQNLKEPSAGSLQTLHQGTFGLPIIPVLAGLAHSKAVLAECGLSRLSADAVQTLGALEAGEPRQAVRRMLEHFGVDVSGADPDRWAGLIEGWSDRWPQHLQNGMRSLAEGLIAANGVLARVDEEAVTAREQERRTGAYRARRSDEMRDSRFLVAAVMTEIDDRGRPQGEVTGLVESMARPDGPVEWRLPRRMEAESFVHHLIATGALQLNDDDRLVCPIPSFRRFLMEKGQQDLRQA